VDSAERAANDGDLGQAVSFFTLAVEVAPKNCLMSAWQSLGMSLHELARIKEERLAMVLKDRRKGKHTGRMLIDTREAMQRAEQAFQHASLLARHPPRNGGAGESAHDRNGHDICQPASTEVVTSIQNQIDKLHWHKARLQMLFTDTTADGSLSTETDSALEAQVVRLNSLLESSPPLPH
jgi:hypothetical protein